MFSKKSPTNHNGEVIKAEALRPGDTIVVVSPSGPVDREGVLRGIEVLEARGYRVEYSPALFDQQGYLAGSDSARLEELNESLQRSDVAAVFCARGGYGTSRILPRVATAALQENPKVFVGFSDITALHVLFNSAGIVTFHGPTLDLSNTDEPDEWSFDMLERVISSSAPVGPIEQPASAADLVTIVPGSAQGRTVGGNLSLICALMGTPYEPVFEDRIVLIEDVGERPYRIDRYLTQLLQAGKLQRAAAVVVGECINCSPPADRPAFSLEWVLRDRLGGLGIPVLWGYAFGHGQHRMTLPLGVTARLEATDQEFEFTEAALL